MSDVKRFTLAEVAAFTGKNDTPIYFVYRDSVYDVTKYMPEHPDGPGSILEEAGKDCTKVFDDVHSKDAVLMLKKYKIGELVEEEKRFDANGKKKKKVITAPPEQTSRGLCSIITCGLVG